MQLVVMFVRLQLRNLLLPIRIKYIAVLSGQALVDLKRLASIALNMNRKRCPTFCHAPVNSCGSGACPWAAI